MTPNSSGGGAALETVAWQSEDFGNSFVGHRALQANGDSQWTRQYTIGLVRRTDASSAIRTLEERVASLEGHIAALLATGPLAKEFHYLDRGIGTKTPVGEVLLAARAVLSKTAQPGIE